MSKETTETWKDPSGCWVAHQGNFLVAVGKDEQKTKDALEAHLHFAEDPNVYRHA